jgi:hypothetical protein
MTPTARLWHAPRRPPDPDLAAIRGALWGILLAIPLWTVLGLIAWSLRRCTHA